VCRNKMARPLSPARDPTRSMRPSRLAPAVSRRLNLVTGTVISPLWLPLPDAVNAGDVRLMRRLGTAARVGRSCIGVQLAVL
jgi:predicted membrane protein